jgi:hypothetical protein
VLFLVELILFGFNLFHVRKKFNMVRSKDSFWEYTEEMENGCFICKFCEKYFVGGILAIKSQLSSVSDREAIQLEAKQALQVI